MTDTSATPEPKKITRTRPKIYPRQVTYMVSDEIADAIEARARREGVSKSEIARYYLSDAAG